MEGYNLKSILNNICEGLIPILDDCEAFIAGGAIRALFANEKIKDIDIFFHSEAKCKEARSKILTELNGNLICETQNATTFDFDREFHDEESIDIQLIKNIYGIPISVLKQFDFTVTQAAYDCRKQIFMFVNSDRFFKHLSQRKLSLGENIPKPLVTLCHRLRKYISYGYKINEVELMKLCLHVVGSFQSHVGVNEDLIDEMTGIDSDLFEEFIQAISGNTDLFDAKKMISAMDRFLYCKASDKSFSFEPNDMTGQPVRKD